MQYGKGINTLVSKLQQLMSAKGKKKASAHESYIQSYVAIIVLFCASGTGVFGAMRERMTGDASILIAKAFLDFFTATIFACTLGIAVAAISVPMLLIQLTLAACAAIIMPLTTPMMLADFSAVGACCWWPPGCASAG
ncbi:inner membrane protein YqgA [Klebsiella pneumoniae]|uniref:Inner membrane protein YqgA n=1 Tax=Klebsiella pneumoniae TaxID=573 RepID=A0A377XFE4_KLEPN|nr:inner membrane protein YqgA [Klebsiella pneumoniae]